MHLEKQAIHTDGRGGPGQRFHHRAVAAGRCAKSARLLYAMSGVKDHWRPQRLHLRQGPHVVYQATVAEKRAPLAQQHISATGVV